MLFVAYTDKLHVVPQVINVRVRLLHTLCV